VPGVLYLYSPGSDAWLGQITFGSETAQNGTIVNILGGPEPLPKRMGGETKLIAGELGLVIPWVNPIFFGPSLPSPICKRK
jgi:hypothetical protein